MTKGGNGIYKLIYGTHNPSKQASMLKMLEGLAIDLKDLSSISKKLIEADEDFLTPIENATQKATTYYQQLKVPVFSCDSGLYFEGVALEDQPGVHIKRIHGQDLSYRGMYDYYQQLADKYGGRLTAYYKNAICLVMSEEDIFQYDGEDLQSEKFYIVNKPHEIYKEGFPLDSLSVEITSGKYYYDLDGKRSKNLGVIKGFRDFFVRNLSL